MDNRGNVHPGRVRNAAGQVELMRRLKDRPGLTYRQTEEAAAESGEILARSTLAGAPAGSTLPRPELVSACVRPAGTATGCRHGFRTGTRSPAGRGARAGRDRATGVTGRREPVGCERLRKLG
ncbi:hypothetical protein [Streptomyces syringium]|uniref:hypothetical protein n=1 Tax=Streptomyces syringium TaxID=76729 RepID=UPI0034538402